MFFCHLRLNLLGRATNVFLVLDDFLIAIRFKSRRTNSLLSVLRYVEIGRYLETKSGCKKVGGWFCSAVQLFWGDFAFLSKTQISFPQSLIQFWSPIQIRGSWKVELPRWRKTQMSKRGRELRNKFSCLPSKKQPDIVYCNTQMYSTGTRFKNSKLSFPNWQSCSDGVWVRKLLMLCVHMEKPRGTD